MSRPNTIAILNQKGGVGKTTTAISLAAYIGKLGKSVLLVDADPQGNATSGMGLDKQQLDTTLYDVLLGQVPAHQAIVETQIENVRLLPTQSQLAGAEVELVNASKREYRLKEVLEGATADLIIIDCPPSLGLLSINALTAANGVLIPVQAEYYALEGLTQLLDVIQRVRGGLNPQLELLGVVMTMYNSRTVLSDQVMKEVKQYFGDKVFTTVIPRNVRLAEAPSHGKPISEYDRWSKGARAYKQLAKELMKRL